MMAAAIIKVAVITVARKLMLCWLSHSTIADIAHLIQIETALGINVIIATS
jgi:hypothetical protein